MARFKRQVKRRQQRLQQKRERQERRRQEQHQRWQRLISENKKAACFYKTQTPESWLICLNRLLFLIEAQINQVSSPLVFEDQNDKQEVIKADQRRRLVKAWAGIIIKDTSFLTTDFGVSLDKIFDLKNLTTLSDVTSRIISSLYKAIYYWGRQAEILESTFDIRSLMTLLSQIEGEIVETAAIDQLVEAYRASIDNNLTRADEITAQNPNYQITIPLTPLTPETEPSEKVLFQDEQSSQITINLSTISVNEIKSLAAVNRHISQSVTEALLAPKHLSLADLNHTQVPLKTQPDAVERVNLGDFFENNIVKKHINAAIVDILIRKKQADPADLAYEIAERVAHELDQISLMTDTGRARLRLRDTLGAYDVSQVREAVQKQVYGRLQQNPEFIRPLSQFSRHLDPPAPSQVRGTAARLIKNQLLINLPQDKRTDSEAVKQVDQLAQKAAHYLVAVEPLASQETGRSGAIIKARAESIKTQIRHSLNQEAADLGLDTAALDSSIETVGSFLSFPINTITPTEVKQPSRYDFVNRQVLFSLLSGGASSQSVQLVLQKGVGLNDLIVRLGTPSSQVAEMAEWLRAGAPVKIGRFQSSLIVPSPPHSLAGSQIEHLAALADKISDAEVEAIINNLPLTAKFYFISKQKLAGFKLRYIDKTKLGLHTLMSLPGQELSLRLEALRREWKEAGLSEDSFRARLLNQALNPTQHQLAQIITSPYYAAKDSVSNFLTESKQKLNSSRPVQAASSWYQSAVKKVKSSRTFRQARARWWLFSKKFNRFKKRFDSFLKSISDSRIVKLLGKIPSWLDPYNLVYRITGKLKKLALKALVKIGAKLAAKLGIEFTLAGTGVGAVLAAAMLAADIASLIRRYWKLLAGAVAAIIYFILQNLAAFIGGVIGSFIGSIFGPVGAAAGFAAGWYIGGLIGKIGAGLSSISSGISSFSIGLGPAGAGVNIPAGVMAVGPPGLAIAAGTLVVVPMLASTLKPTRLIHFKQGFGSPYISVIKSATLPLDKYPYTEPSTGLPHLSNQAAKDRAKIAYKIIIKPTAKPITITQVSDKIVIYKKDQSPITKNFSFDVGQGINLDLGGQQIFEYEFTLEPDYTDSRIINTVTVEANIQTEEGRSQSGGRSDSFGFLVGEAPQVGCQNLAKRAETLGRQLVPNPSTTSQEYGCIQVDKSLPQLGIFKGNYSCGPPGVFQNYILGSQIETTYIQCTEFVHDTFRYEVGLGIPNLCPAGMGNAADWLGKCPSQFETIYNDGSNDPQLGDILVFTGKNKALLGHVAVVTSIDGNVLTLYGANTKPQTFNITKNGAGVWGSFADSYKLAGWLRYKFCQAN